MRILIGTFIAVYIAMVVRFIREIVRINRGY